MTKQGKINSKLDDAYSGTFSLLGTWASALYIAADIFLSDLGTAIASVVLMVFCYITSKLIGKKIKAMLRDNPKSHKTKAFLDKIHGCSNWAAYLNIGVLVASFIYNILKLSSPV